MSFHPHGMACGQQPANPGVGKPIILILSQEKPIGVVYNPKFPEEED